ncbi:MAG: diacylglycerol/lipid kinase family protein, partial [Coprococcus sp.]
MSMSNYHFIVNSAASSGAGYRTWKTVEAVLEEENVQYRVYFPKNGKETELLTRQLTRASAEDCHLIILGGDGTLNAVLQGIECFEHTKISCIRTGSGNDFARNMHVTKDVRKALYNILHHPRERILDYGELYLQRDSADEGVRRRFIISSGVGYDADICEEVSRSRLKSIMNRIHMGKLVYVLIGIKQIFTRQSGKAIIQIDDNK